MPESDKVRTRVLVSIVPGPWLLESLVSPADLSPCGSGAGLHPHMIRVVGTLSGQEWGDFESTEQGD